MKKVLCIALVVALAGIGYAEEQAAKERYVGLGYQGATYNEDGFDEDIQMNGAYISYGSKFHEYIAGEIKIGFLTGTLDMDNAFGTGVDISATLTGVNTDIIIKPQYAIEQFSVYGMLGLSFLFTSIDVEGSFGGVTESETTTDSALGFVIGAGVAYDFGNFGVNAEVSTYQYSDYDLTPLFSIGGRYNF